MTSNKEDYLKAIYEEGGLEHTVSNKTIALRLGVAPASVTEMLTKLESQGLIQYKAYKGSMLTAAGACACIEVVRSHRLWEVFFMRYLGYSWREAHEDAHLLEHAAPSRLVDRLEKFLDYPAACPHGFVIPQKGQEIIPDHFIRLADLSEGEKALVDKVTEDGELLDYLEYCGLEIEKPIVIEHKEAYEGRITFCQTDKRISISFKAATQVYVKLWNNGKEE